MKTDNVVLRSLPLVFIGFLTGCQNVPIIGQNSDYEIVYLAVGGVLSNNDDGAAISGAEITISPSDISIIKSGTAKNLVLQDHNGSVGANSVNLSDVTRLVTDSTGKFLGSIPLPVKKLKDGTGYEVTLKVKALKGR